MLLKLLEQTSEPLRSYFWSGVAISLLIFVGDQRLRAPSYLFTALWKESPFCGRRHLVDFIVFSVPADFGKYPGTPSRSKGYSQSLHGPKWIFLKPRTTAPNASPSVDNYLASLEVCKTFYLPEKTLSVSCHFPSQPISRTFMSWFWNE